MSYSVLLCGDMIPNTTSKPQTRDNRIYYYACFSRLLYMHLLMSTFLLGAVCGRHSDCFLVNCHDHIDGSGFSVLYNY